MSVLFSIHGSTIFNQTYLFPLSLVSPLLLPRASPSQIGFKKFPSKLLKLFFQLLLIHVVPSSSYTIVLTMSLASFFKSDYSSTNLVQSPSFNFPLYASKLELNLDLPDRLDLDFEMACFNPRYDTATATTPSLTAC
ncbi:hypothetical protein K438DRAFT_1778348 [Mycena galopus ATCC 62051]|nr:hypothetical protein K438DRAFT_1778348 [Mycena galopus ATCC 62051]